MNTVSYMKNLADAASSNGQTAKSIFELSLTAMKQVVDLNGDFTRSLIKDTAAHLTELDRGEQAAVQARQIEQASEYFRLMNEVFIKTQGEIARVGANHARDLMETAFAQVDELIHAQALENPTVAKLLKGTFGNAGSAYEDLINTVREATEANLAVVMRIMQPEAEAPARAAEPARKAA